MKIIIELDEDLVTELQRIATAGGQTLTSVIENALRESLADRARSERRCTELPIFHGTGLLPGVDLCRSAALADRMDGEPDPP